MLHADSSTGSNMRERRKHHSSEASSAADGAGPSKKQTIRNCIQEGEWPENSLDGTAEPLTLSSAVMHDVKKQVQAPNLGPNSRVSIKRSTCIHLLRAAAMSEPKEERAAKPV